jgi:hypothetical protein
MDKLARAGDPTGSSVEVRALTLDMERHDTPPCWESEASDSLLKAS